MRLLSLSISQDSLVTLVENQLKFFWPDGNNPSLKLISHSVDLALKRVRLCFDPINLKYYTFKSASFFNHLHGDHYSSFLYLMSTEAFREGDEALAAKLFLLNKTMFGIDAFYGIELPEHFLFVHPLGTVLGNATYEDFFVVYQGVTIGSTTEGIYPTFSNSTILYSNSSVIGSASIGSNFVLAANASLINTAIPANSVIVGNYPNHKVLENKKNLIQNYFNI